MSNLDNLTLKEIKELKNLFISSQPISQEASAPIRSPFFHPMLGRKCLIRTYSAGVHIGNVVWINPENSMECKLENALRLWKWSDGGLSLSAVANNGIKNGRLNRTGEVFLTNAIEYIPTTLLAEKTYEQFIEDEK